MCRRRTDMERGAILGDIINTYFFADDYEGEEDNDEENDNGEDD